MLKRIFGGANKEPESLGPITDTEPITVTNCRFWCAIHGNTGPIPCGCLLETFARLDAESKQQALDNLVQAARAVLHHQLHCYSNDDECDVECAALDRLEASLDAFERKDGDP